MSFGMFGAAAALGISAFGSALGLAMMKGKGLPRPYVVVISGNTTSM